MSLIDLNNELAAYQGQLSQLTKKYEQDKRDLESRIKETQRKINETWAGLDTGKIDLAETFFDFEGDPRKYPESEKAIADARKAIAASDQPLQERYIGLKNYSSWIGQREDHEYGYGPRHGSIVFRIGVKNKWRGKPLSKDAREAALYYLHAWPQIAEARAKA